MKGMMTEKKSPLKPADSLRKRAERRISKSPAGLDEKSTEKMSSEESQELIQELRIHHIELEIQNEALRRSQLETLESHRRYEELFNFAPVGYFTLDKKGHIKEANVTGASLLGFEKRSLIGESFHRFVVPEYLSTFQSHLHQAGKGQGKEACRLKLAGKDGPPFDALIETMAAADNDGAFDYYRSCLTDITQLTRQEELAYLSTFPTLSPSPTMEVDTAGSIHFMNPAAKRLFPDLMILELKHPWLADWETVKRTFLRDKAKETTREIQIGDRWFGQALYFMEDTGKIRIYGREITKRKKTEIALHEKTLQLESANKDLENFSYSVSHDLRAPLRAVDGYARMILKKHGTGFDKDTLDKFSVIRTNAQRISLLIDDLLTFSRLSRVYLSMFKVNMDDLFRETWKDLQTIHHERSMSLKINPVPYGKGDRALIKQVLNHILSNAVKFTKAHEDTLVEVGGYEEGNEIIYYIRDKGIGFDMKYHDKLFGVFQRLHTNDEYEGTGVGLALVQRIIQRHGGRVWAEGEVDQGACFYFTLPKA